MSIFVIMCLLLVLNACVSEEPLNKEEIYENDYVSSSSVLYQYMDYYLKGDELKKAINSNKGICIVSTLNSDGTSNSSLFNLEMLDTKYIIAEFYSDNQTFLNLKNKPQGMIVFLQYKVDEKERFNYVGAKILFDYIYIEEDITNFETSYARLLKEREALFRIVEIRPLG